MGTSSWADPGFVREWYPSGLAARERLRYYSQRFQAVEVNSTFYNLPNEAMVARWAQVTPAAFSFDVKLHRALSRHVAFFSSLPSELCRYAQSEGGGRLRLTKPLELVLTRQFLSALSPLIRAGKLSSLLLQLAPSFSPARHDLTELDDMIELISPRRLAIEFRHRDWVQGEQLQRTVHFLRQREVAFVCVDAPRAEHATIMPSELNVVSCARLGYLRAHGRNTDGYLHGKSVAERFAYRYSDQELQGMIERVRSLAAGLQSGDVRVMLNNNRGRDAPDAARRMRELLSQN
ncbi:MAG TPA: DUF72 domain-containing protein [Solirubrobacteraceae bacterium]